MRTTLLVLLLLSGVGASLFAQAPAARSGNVRIFLDCSHYCDDNYVRQEITFVDHMRDRADADVHILVTAEENGGGGRAYTVKFIGLGPFAGVEQTLRYNSPQTATDDERRRGLTETLKRGLVRYVSESPIAHRLKITLSPETSDTKAAPAKDRWNLWVFRTNFGGSFEGEESNTSRSFRGSASASRTTELWKVNFSGSTRYGENKYDLGEGDIYTSVSRTTEFSALTVRSLTQHWSLGVVGNLYASTYLNYDRRLRIAPGIEYNFFPYSESTRRMFTVQYTVGVDSHDYREVTIYDKTSETLADHRLGTALSLRQPWGTVYSSVDFSQYLTQPSKYRISAFGETDIRLFKGFSFNIFTSLSRTRDQIYLPRGAATTEEILVRQRQLATGYQYYLNFGFSYSFGSIFNNVVNPRFGGSGEF